MSIIMKYFVILADGVTDSAYFHFSVIGESCLKQCKLSQLQSQQARLMLMY